MIDRRERAGLIQIKAPGPVALHVAWLECCALTGSFLSPKNSVSSNEPRQRSWPGLFLRLAATGFYAFGRPTVCANRMMCSGGNCQVFASAAGTFSRKTVTRPAEAQYSLRANHYDRRRGGRRKDCEIDFAARAHRNSRGDRCCGDIAVVDIGRGARSR